MELLAELLRKSAEYHHQLCPKQVLGVRMGILAGELLGIPVPQAKASKRLIAIVETDGCMTSGIAAATNCWVGRRTMRVEDYGKVAATFVDTETGQGIRIVPRSSSRELAAKFAPEAEDSWHAMLLGYQRMPDEDLLLAQPVSLNQSIESLMSRPGAKAICEACGEEIINEREILEGGRVWCRACAGDTYYSAVEEGAKIGSSRLRNAR